VKRVALASGLVLFASATARAEPYRLRADALASAQSPTGLLALSAEGAEGPSLSAEALVWVGAGDEDEAQALVVAVRARRPSGAAEARLGRFVVSAGGLRPVHLDGVASRVRLPYRLAVESFGGSPVAPGQDGRTWDWLVGGRVSRALGDWGSAGVAYLHRRDGGRLADEEIAVDAGGAAADWLDLSARAAFDLSRVGLAEASASAAGRLGAAWRVELHGTERSPSRLLPATSLFSVLGDVPSRRIGTAVRWRAAPRLDLRADVGALAAGGEWGEMLAARALLRLDDRGVGAVGAELRREAAPEGGWTGARATGRAPIGAGLVLATELELAMPDHPAGRGAVWPWGLVALRRQIGGWEAAAAVEASSSPEHRYRIDALARLAGAWELR
jgi:hypothetical protein